MRCSPGDVVYIWHGALHGDVAAAGLAACGLHLRAQIIWASGTSPWGAAIITGSTKPCWYAVREGRTSHWGGDRTQTTVWEIADNNPFGNPSGRHRHDHRLRAEDAAQALA